jgi:hypothetical protein
MTIRLNGQTSGYVELEAPATAGSNTLVLPTNNGTSGQYLQTNGSGALSWQTVADTNTNQITKVDVAGDQNDVTTGIPSDAKILTFAFYDLNTSVATSPLFQFGKSDGTFTTSGYEAKGGWMGVSNGNGIYNDTGGIVVQNADTSLNVTGSIRCQKLDDRRWVWSGVGYNSGSGYIYTFSGTVQLASGYVVDRIRLHVNSGTFDSGEFCVYYEV